MRQVQHTSSDFHLFRELLRDVASVQLTFKPRPNFFPVCWLKVPYLYASFGKSLDRFPSSCWFMCLVRTVSVHSKANIVMFVFVELVAVLWLLCHYFYKYLIISNYCLSVFLAAKRLKTFLAFKIWGNKI